ncbi:hypothetical protein GWI33_019183, partial [Rhynchophorus ferrugineus]
IGDARRVVLPLLAVRTLRRAKDDRSLAIVKSGHPQIKRWTSETSGAIGYRPRDGTVRGNVKEKNR